MLQGSLENFDLSDVLGLLSNTSKSGRLRLTGDRGTGSLWLEDGALVNGIIGVRTDAPLEEMVFELMRFTAGDFSFSVDERPVQAGNPQEVVAVVKGAAARLDEWRSIEAVVPSLAHIVRPVHELPSEEVTITRRDWEVLLAAGPGASVGSVCTALELGEIDGSREVKHLVDRGLLVVFAPINAQVIERSVATAEEAGVITDGPEDAVTNADDFHAFEPPSFEPPSFDPPSFDPPSVESASFEPVGFEPDSFAVAADEVAPFDQSAERSPFEDIELERVEERVQESFLTRNDLPSFADARHEQLADSEQEPLVADPTSTADFEPAPFPPAPFQAVPEAPIDVGPKDRPVNTSRSIDFGVPTPPPPVSPAERGFFGTASNDEGFVFDQMPEDAGFAGESPADFHRPAAPGFAHAGLGVPGAGWDEERRANASESDWSAPVEASAAAPGWAQGWSSEAEWQTASQGPVGAPPVPQPPAGFPQPSAGAAMPVPPPPGFAGGAVPPPPPPAPPAAPPIDFGQPFDPVLAADQTRTAIANPDLAKQEMTELLAEDAKTDEGGGSLLMRYLKSER